MTVTHPAKFSTPVLDRMQEIIAERFDHPVVLDPFAGTGLIHSLTGCSTYGVEIEPEWATMHPRTYVGDARVLPFADATVDVIATSPCYGNRMADTYDGRGTCKACGGEGEVEVGDDDGFGGSHVEHCPRCGGEGRDRSRRHTYTIGLGRPLSDGNAGAMQWGDAYRDLHEAAVAEWVRVLRRPTIRRRRTSALALVNMSNHVRQGAEQFVVEWWVATLARHGFIVEGIEPIQTRRMRHGQNYERRVDGERLIVASL